MQTNRYTNLRVSRFTFWRNSTAFQRKLLAVVKCSKSNRLCLGVRRAIFSLLWAWSEINNGHNIHGGCNKVKRLTTRTIYSRGKLQVVMSWLWPAGCEDLMTSTRKMASQRHSSTRTKNMGKNIHLFMIVFSFKAKPQFNSIWHNLFLQFSTDTWYLVSDSHLQCEKDKNMLKSVISLRRKTG